MVYGINPKPGATYVYDLIRFIINTQESQDNITDPASIPDLISSIKKYNSSIFGTVNIDSDGFFVTNATLRKVIDGKVVKK